MGPGEWVGLVVGVLAILAAAWRLIRSIYHLVRVGETALDRLTGVEKELHPNGGASLRDAVDKTHALAVDNNEKHTRIEQRLDSAARLAGEAATRAAKADQGLAELREETQARHVENVRRLDHLERQDEDAKILRELLLMSLKDNHGIDLLPDDDDE